MVSLIDNVLKYQTNDPDYIVFKTIHKETLQKISENASLKENEAIKSA